MKRSEKEELNAIIGLTMLYVCQRLSRYEELALNNWRSVSEENEHIFQILTSPELCQGLVDEYNKIHNTAIRLSPLI